jgi:penicillin-binding protein 1C
MRYRGLRFVALLFGGLIGLLLSVLAVIWFTLPSVDVLHQRAQAPTTKILDRHGRLLYEIIDSRDSESGRHTPVPLSRIPAHLRNATIAVEDASFYTNPGVDAAGIARAVWINVRGGEALAGGSTITQQLARMLLLNPDERTQRTAVRKLRESLLAWQIAQRYNKDDVLALYLNEAYFGNLAYGVEAAARAYFGKSVSELDLAECAFLAGLPQSPVAYDPFNDLALARKRQTIVLDLMVKQRFISDVDALVAKQAKLTLAPNEYAIRAPHFVSYVRHWLEREYGVDAVMRGGLVVTTTLDLGLNDAAVATLRGHLAQLADRRDFAEGHNANNAALVAIDPRTGEILAMVGSPRYFDHEISGAVNAAVALRQPGSAIKPITYAAALASGDLTAATPLFDVRTAFPTREGLPYIPVNYDRRHHGPISARDALATSNNVAAVSVLQHIGLRSMLNLANALGIRSFKSPGDYGFSLALGGGEVRLLELTAAYGAFANAGNRVDAFPVLEITNGRGEVLFNRKSIIEIPKSVLDARVAWLISDILSDNRARATAFGEGSVLQLSRKAAVKTGTTQDFRDNWTVGYTPQLVTGVWVGNADGAPMTRISGVSGAGPIWHDFMEIAHRNLPPTWFEMPHGLVQTTVCELSGLLPTADCPHTRTEWFIDGTQPTRSDTWHRRVHTEANALQTRVMLDVPLPVREWARQQGWPLLGDAASPNDAMPNIVTIAQPDAGAIFRTAKELPDSVQRVPIEIQINDPARVARVDVMTQFGQRIASFDQAPYRTFWPLMPGEHILTARAFLRDGSFRDSAPVHITVQR